jgi:SAM-dependent methyltransferase
MLGTGGTGSVISPTVRHGNMSSASAVPLEMNFGRAQKVTILEPAGEFQNPNFEYVKPDISGRMPFADNSFDLVTCFGVLHHIPNVSAVVSEMAWVAQSLVVWAFAREGKKTRQLRSSFLILLLMLFARFALFPALWIGNLCGHGDSLLAIATKGQGDPEFDLQTQSSAVVRGKNISCVRKD